MYTNSCNSVSFDINGVTIPNVGLSIKYLGVNLTVCNNVLTFDVEDRIRKFNMAAYYVLLKTSDLNEVRRCELIVKKCLPVLLYEIGGVSITNCKIAKYTLLIEKYSDIFLRCRYVSVYQTY